jgi:ubiquinone/menaquinone biosynthesis C-methylase UbiE
VTKSGSARITAKTATDYDDAHMQEGDEHYVALANMVQAQSVLDVVCGTGRAHRFLAGRSPELMITGVEPVAKLLARGEEVGGATYLKSRGDDLPFDDGAFDVAYATGVLHHVRGSAQVVAEMMRVASRAVFISDNNRFGQGCTSVKFAKLVLYRMGLWPAFDYIRTKGKGPMRSEGDGVFYS